MSPHVHDRYAEGTPFWRQVRLLLTTDDYQQPVIYITSEYDPLRGLIGGVVKEAPPKLAAQCVVNRTHRLSKPEEIEAYKQARQAEIDRCAKQETARKETTNVTTTIAPSAGSNEQLAALVGAAVQAALASKDQPPGKKKE